MVNLRRFDAPQLRDDENVRVLARHDATVERRRLDAGFQQGYTDGQAHAAAEVEEAIADHRRNAQRLNDTHLALGEAITELRTADMCTVDEIELTVIELSMRIAESIVQREINDHDLVIERIRQAVQLAPRDTAIEIRVHPSEHETATESIEAGLCGRLDDVELIPDPAVGRGGCTVDAGDAHIDAQIDGAVARVRADLGLG